MGRLSEARRKGEEIKRRVMKQSVLSPIERRLFNDTNVLARPMGYADEDGNVPYQTAGDTYYQPFVGQPYSSKPYVNILEKPLIPRFNQPNLERFGTDSFITPEEVLPHELGHVYSQAKWPLHERPFNFENDIRGEHEEFRAEDFKNKILGRNGLALAYALRLLNPRNRQMEKLTYSQWPSDPYSE